MMMMILLDAVAVLDYFGWWRRWGVSCCVWDPGCYPLVVLI